MQRKPLRGLVLRALSVSVTTTMILSGTAAVSTAAPAPTAKSTIAHDVPAPSTVWNPPTTVDRTPIGGQPPATAWHRATSSTPAHAAPRHVVPCGVNGTGILQQFPLSRYKVDDRMQLAVNLATGNLVIDNNDLAIAGTGQNLAVDHVYNSLMASSFAPVMGWGISVGQDVGLQSSGSNMVLYGDSGYCVTFTQNADGSYAEPSGLHASLAHNGDGSYTLTFDSTGQKWSFTSDGWLTSQADRNGNANTYRYNSDGTTASVTDSQGRVTQFSYQNGQLATITDPTGTTAGSYHYNAEGQIDAFTDRNGFTVKYGYDSAQNLASLTDPAGGTYTFGYDSSSRLTALTLPTPDGTGDTTTYAYGDQQTTETNPLGKSSVYHFDDQDRQTSATDPLGHTRSTTWTAASDVQTTADSLNNSTTYQYDPLNNYAGTKLPTGASSVVGYTDTTHPHLATSVKDPQGDELTRSYDTAGNLTTVHSTGLNADIDKRTYNPNGTLATDTDGNGHTTSYGYDSAGNLTSATPPAPAGKTSYTYDSLSRISTATDGNGVQLKYSYDKLDRVVLISQVGGPGLQSYGYDGNGNRVYSQTDTATITTTFRPRNLISKSVRDDGLHTTTVSYGYDKASNLTTMADPSGTTTYGYDAANRLTSQLDPFGQTTTFGYDNADHRTTTTFPGAGTQTTGYDAAGRQTSVRFATTAGTTLVNVSYSYTRPGGGDSDLMQSKTDATGTTSYTYDPLERLKTAGSNTYSLDNAGNLLSGEGHTFAVNNADQFTSADSSSLTFDGAGNLSASSSPATSFSYSPTNQLTSSSQSGTQVFQAGYDTADQTQPAAITERVGSTTTTHAFAHTELGTSQVTDNGTAADFVHDPKGLLTTLKGLDGKRYNAVTDYQGSVLALIDTSGNQAATYTYSPYGTTTATGAAAAANPLRWLGQFQLKNGMYLMGYRFYNPAYERFTSADPTGQERNPYAYAGEEPVTSSDPTGAATGEDFACGAANALVYAVFTAPIFVEGVTVAAQWAIWGGGIGWSTLTAGGCQVNRGGMSEYGYEAVTQAP